MSWALLGVLALALVLWIWRPWSDDSRVVVGTVTAVSEGNTSICITPDGGKETCVRPALPAEQTIPKQGDHVRALIVEVPVRVDQDSHEEILAAVEPAGR